MSDWSEYAIWWHVYPLGATGAPVRPTPEERDAAEAEPVHRLRHLLGWLDHVVSLGCNGLLLGPVFASDTHGYDTTDFFRIDPRLGDEQDLADLVAACRERGIRVLLDGVFNHVGTAHPLFTAALDAGAGSAEAALFRIDFSGDTPVHHSFEGHESLATLDHDEPAVADLVAEVMTHWLARGIDGWRLDAAYAVPNDFWARVLPRVRDEYPDAWFMGEVIHGDYAGFVTEGTADSVTQYELWKAVWSSLEEENFFELDWTLTRHTEFLGTFVPQTFVGNHDTTRIATRVGADKAVLAAVVLFTVGGSPSIYAGDEYAWEGLKEERLGGDDAVRPILPATPPGEGPGPEGAGAEVAGAEVPGAGVPGAEVAGAEVSGAEVPGADGGDGAALNPSAARMLGAYRSLIAIRRRNPWLTRARTENVELTNTRYVYEAVGQAGERLRVTLDLDAGAHAEITDVTTGEVLFAVTR